MIFDRARAWPHPVLSPLTDDILPNDFDFDLTVESALNEWHLKVTAHCGDEMLSRRVADRDAHFLLHLECKRTYFRAGWANTTSSWEIKIPEQSLYGHVEASFLIVAARDIDIYRHPRQHADFRDTEFALAVGEPLAVALTKTFDAYFDIDPILKLSSIIDIKKGSAQSELMEVQCEGDRILVTLTPDDFERYRMLRAGPGVRGLLATSVVLPALLQSFNYLRVLDPDDFQRFKDEHRWTRSIVPRLEQMNVDLRAGNAAEDISLRAAQKLLHGPLARSLADVQSMIDSVA
jgi:hypothetical protein